MEGFANTTTESNTDTVTGTDAFSIIHRNLQFLSIAGETLQDVIPSIRAHTRCLQSALAIRHLALEPAYGAVLQNVRQACIALLRNNSLACARALLEATKSLMDPAGKEVLQQSRISNTAGLFWADTELHALGLRRQVQYEFKAGDCMFDSVRHAAHLPHTTQYLRALSMEALETALARHDSFAHISLLGALQDSHLPHHSSKEAYIAAMRKSARDGPGFIEGDETAMVWLCKALRINVNVWNTAAMKVQEHRYNPDSQTVYHVVHAGFHYEPALVHDECNVPGWGVDTDTSAPQPMTMQNGHAQLQSTAGLCNTQHLTQTLPSRTTPHTKPSITHTTRNLQTMTSQTSTQKWKRWTKEAETDLRMHLTTQAAHHKQWSSMTVMQRASVVHHVMKATHGLP